MWKLSLAALWVLGTVAACHEESQLICEPDTVASNGQCVPVVEVSDVVDLETNASDADASDTAADADASDANDVEALGDADVVTADLDGADSSDTMDSEVTGDADADASVGPDLGPSDVPQQDSEPSDAPEVGDGAGSDTPPSDSGGADGGSTAPNDSPFNANPACLSVDKVDASTIVPPAGVRVTFRVLDCDGNPVRPLEDGDVVVINDESGKDFNDSTEGGSASPQLVGEDTELFTVLTLDLSSSVVDPDNTGATCGDTATCVAMVDAAKAFVETTLADTVAFDHKIAIMGFGSTSLTAVEQFFTADKTVLLGVLDGLKSAGPRGTTNLYGAYMAAIDLVKTEGTAGAVVERFALIMTDGTHQAGDAANLRTQALQAKATSGVRTYSVALAATDYDLCTLEELAGSGCREDTGCITGTAAPASCYQYLSVPASDGLVDAFETMAGRVLAIARSNYVVGVCTPIELGAPSLTVQATVDGPVGTGTASYATDTLTGELAGCSPVDIAQGDP